ncbi:hypothetical protein KEM55_004854 [Ascosphaera atra]|nr:hypothetical protein KEM55_004854 [Ascosphaera atra]
MATAVVARGCAERVYDGVRRRRNRGGVKGKEMKDDEDAMEATPVGARCFEECTEDEAVESVIRDEFMNHPGVKGSSCHAGIGLMAVKKEKYGVGFYFGHNTESFVILVRTALSTDVRVKVLDTDGISSGAARVAQD